MQALSTCILLLLLTFCANAEPAPVTPGENLYRLGMLSSGEPLIGAREHDINVQGATAACVSCHRRSGLGTQEGSYVIPPIIGKYLFRAGLKNVEDINLPHIAGYRSSRSAYTDVTLARAIREGLDADGRSLNYLMPRFKLNDADMASLIEYLKTLTSQPVPGVSDDTLHFATIITPDADPVKRQGMLNVMEQFFTDKNSFIRGGGRPMQGPKGHMYRVSRRWQLHVWELTGVPETWEQQLKAKLAAEPVYAVISGLGGRTWAPIHQFCEREAVPCLFPNVDVPVIAENDFYPVYFFKGVFLEAQLLSKQLQLNDMQGSGPHRVIQVYRQGDIGEAAAKTLQGGRFEVVNRTLAASGSAKELAGALDDVGDGDVLMLWLRPKDIALLPSNVVPGRAVYFSGLMGGLENSPLPATWRSVAHMTYPFDLPELRKIRMNFPLTWLKIKHIPIVDERVQSDTYLACGILAETLTDMLDSFVRDYLVERIEVMLSHRIITSYYPRLGLAPSQRFASKGGYITHFANPAGPQLAADGEWIVP